MEALIEYLAKEWRVIIQAPATFSVALALCIGVVWAALSWAYLSRFEGQASTLSSLEGRLKLKDDQIADYKDKLSGASPNEAKARMDALELQIKALSPRRLSEKEKSSIVNTLKGTKGAIYIAQDMAAADAKPLSADLAAAFQSAGWGVGLPLIMGPSNPPPTGLALRVVDPNALRANEQVVRAALQSAGLNFDLQGGLTQRFQRPQQPRGLPEVPQEPDPDVELLITTRAN